MPWTADKTTVKKTVQEILSEEVYIEEAKIATKVYDKKEKT